MTASSPRSFFPSSRLLKAVALAVPVLAFYFLDRPIARLANETIEPTFEHGVLVSVLDMAAFAGVGALSVYAAIRVWNAARP